MEIYIEDFLHWENFVLKYRAVNSFQPKFLDKIISGISGKSASGQKTANIKSVFFMQICETRRYGGLQPPTSSSSGGDLGALWAPNYSKYSTVKYSTGLYSTVQYSTVTGEEDGVRGWLTPYSTPCVVAV